MVGVHVDVTARKRGRDRPLRRAARRSGLPPPGSPTPTIRSARSCSPPRRRSSPRAVRAGALHDIVEDTKRAARIVKSILQFARGDTERTQLDLCDCVRRAGPDASHCRVGVSLELRLRGPAHAVANATEIEQALGERIRTLRGPARGQIGWGRKTRATRCW
jgi:signal transduction histidine kinase